MYGRVVSSVISRIRRLGRLTHLADLLRERARTQGHLLSSDRHLAAAAAWLSRAQDVTSTGGVSAGYYFDQGWRAPYPETTGYIIPTFLQLAAHTGNDEFRERAVRMADWELSIQLDSGALPGGVGVNDYPIVFNTGQVILGWMAMCRQTGDARYLEAAQRAADWLVSVQDDDGKWSCATYLNCPHAYHTRVAWPLLDVWSETGESRYRTAGEANIRWVLAQTAANGWIDHMGFTEDEAPLTHTIAYTLRGLLESARLLGGGADQACMKVVRRAAEQLLLCFERGKTDPYGSPRYLPGRFDEGWKPRADFSCLTGSCQLAIIWLKLYRRDGDARYLNGALKLIDQVKATQSLSSGNPGIRGGIAGSFPLGGGYAAYAYPNWPPKFFADALMLLESTIEPQESGGI